MKGQCTWFSYNTQSWNCILYRTCPEIEESDQFLSGQKDCQYPILSNDFDFFEYFPKDNRDRKNLLKMSKQVNFW